MHAAHQHRDQWTGCGRKRRTGHPHAEWKHQDIIKQNVEQTSANGSGHRDGRRIVIARERRKCVIAHKKRRSDHCNPQITGSKRDQFRIRSKQRKKWSRQKDSHQNENQAAEHAPCDRLREKVIRILSLRLADAVTCRRSDANHRTNRIHQSIHRQNQIQHCQSIRALTDRYKKCVRKNIDGDSDHSCNALCYIFCKFSNHCLLSFLHAVNYG